MRVENQFLFLCSLIDVSPGHLAKQIGIDAHSVALSCEMLFQRHLTGRHSVSFEVKDRIAARIFDMLRLERLLPDRQCDPAVVLQYLLPTGCNRASDHGHPALQHSTLLE